MKYMRICFVFMLAIILCSCDTGVQKHEDPFYNDFGTRDSARFPLIKPYYVIYIDKEYGWQMPLLADSSSNGLYYYYNLHDIKKIAVKDDVIIIYTPYIEAVDESVGHKVLHWFVIVPSSNLEAGFDNESEFLRHIQSYGIAKPAWQNPDDLYRLFFKTGCLAWIPDCD